MSPIAEALSPVAAAALEGLIASPKTLPPWLFYDEHGSHLFEQITRLPEYYLTRTERGLLERHAEDILRSLGAPVTFAELGAGTATKTGVLLAAATRMQNGVLYQPIDVSPTALDEAAAHIEAAIPNVTVRSTIANYITEPFLIDRAPGTKVLALYIGSSIGNFSPEEARAILTNLRAHLQHGDALLLGTDLAPSANKSVAALLSAYDDDAQVTAHFNLNVLTRLNRELGANFDLNRFHHQARWNAAHSRIEMHLASDTVQVVTVPAGALSEPAVLHFAPGETIHTENSYKFTTESLSTLLTPAGFVPTHTFTDPGALFALTLAVAV